MGGTSNWGINTMEVKRGLFRGIGDMTVEINMVRNSGNFPKDNAKKKKVLFLKLIRKLNIPRNFVFKTDHFK